MERWTTVQEVLAHSWPETRFVGSFVFLCHRAYDATSKGLSAGWNSPWSDDETASRIEQAREGLLSEMCFHYNKLKPYNLDGRSAKWNAVALAFTARAALRVMSLNVRDDRRKLLASEAKLLAEARVLVHPLRIAIEEYTQADLYEALYCLSSRWNETTPSDALWAYLEMLEDRASELITLVHPREVVDGGSQWVRNVSRGNFACSHEFVSDVATMIVLFHRSRKALRFLEETKGFSFVKAEGKAGPYVIEDVKEGFRKWIDTGMSLVGEVGSGSKLRGTVRVLACYPGERERYERENQGRETSDIGTLMEKSRPSLEVSWWSGKLGKGGSKAMFDPEEIGKFPSEIAVLKFFDMYMVSKENFHWWPEALVVEKDFMQPSKVAAVVNRKPPTIVQVMGLFLVVDSLKKKAYVAKDAVTAVAVWCFIVFRQRNGTYRLINTSKKLPILKELLEEWSGEAGKKKSEESAKDRGNMVEVED